MKTMWRRTSTHGSSSLERAECRTKRVGARRPGARLLRASLLPAVVLGATLLGTALPVAAAHAAVITVPGDYTSIQAALNAAEAGDRIDVGPGTFVENIVWPDTPSLHLVGSGMDETTIDGGQVGITVHFPNTAPLGRDTEMEGFTITGGYGDEYPLFLGGGIFMEYADATLHDLHITGNVSTFKGGGIAVLGGDPHLHHLVITNNHASSRGGALYIRLAQGDYDHLTVADNTADGFGGGIYFDDASANVISSCALSDNSDADLTVEHPYPPTAVEVEYSCVERGASGLVRLNSGQVVWGDGNVAADPLFADASAGDYHLLASSPCIDAGDPAFPLDPDGTRNDIGAFYYDQSLVAVSDGTLAARVMLSSAPNPFNPRTTIRFALPDAASVRLGVYTASGRLVARLIDGVTTAGEHRVVWSGRDTSGNAVASGTYFCRLEGAGVLETRSLTLLR